MEYDDNDFGGQNPQLNSEEVVKSSTGLSTYSLPKYDFDESLQGDIRFDSLVETQSFLGIGSQEDTSWMDDFSRGSTRIEFGSGDAEPGSILSGNNVWSDATSLESVEMLLKSVGQEEMVNEETEGQDCSALQQLGSSTMQLTPDEEKRDHLGVKDVSLGVTLQVKDHIKEVPDDDNVKRHPVENVKNVCGKLSSPGSGNDVDPIFQVKDLERVMCPVKEDTQAMNKDTSVEKKPELTYRMASGSFESDLQDCPQTTGQFAENSSTRLNQGNDSNDSSNQMVQTSDTQCISDTPLNDSVDGVNHMVLEKELKTEGPASENTVAKLEGVEVSEHMDAISGDEPASIGPVNDQSKEMYGSPSEELHDFNSRVTCLGQTGSPSPAPAIVCKQESDKHINTHAFQVPNVTLEGESALTGHAAESTTPNFDAFCDEKLCTDVLRTNSAVVHKICVGPELAEFPEGPLTKGDEICAAIVEEDKSFGEYELMENTVPIRKFESSLNEDDDVLRIPGDEIDSKLAVNSPHLSIVCSSAVLASVDLGTEDTSVCITPSGSEEHISNIINISASIIVESDSMETNSSPCMTDGNDKCVDTRTHVQFNFEASSLDTNICNAGSLLIDDSGVSSPNEIVCHTQNEETPCDSPTAILVANRRDDKEPETALMVVSCGAESKDDSDNLIQCQSGQSGTACTNDGPVLLDTKASDASDNDKPFSFIITSSAECSERETVKLWQPFTSEVPVSSQNVDKSPSIPVVDQIILGNQGSQKITDDQIMTGSNSASGRKSRRPPGNTSKESAKRRCRQKPTTPKLKESNVFPTVESDQLNLSPPSIVRRQQFTDLQQLQLRAQIFVYGSLIQGTTPDEACMVAAFGGPDGGRSIWESARQQCLERIQCQKSQDSKPETSSQQHSSARTLSQKSKTSRPQAKSKAVPPGKASKSTSTQSTNGNITPPASPLWTLHTPDHMRFGGMPLEHNVHHQSYSHSSSPLTTTVAHTSSWSPHLAPWVASPQTAAGKANPSLMTRSKMEPVILTSIRESDVSEISVRHSSPGPDSRSVSQNTSILKVPPHVIDDRTLIINSCQTVSDSKPIKRKKDVHEPKFELTSAACVRGIAPATVATQNSESNVRIHTSSLATVVASSGDHIMEMNIKADDKIPTFDDMCSKVDEAKIHAEEAAACSVTAVDISQKMWSQLAKQKDSGVSPDVEAKIVSAALAIAAALAVAKAAAAAAKVALDAAVQAKYMAEEAMNSSKPTLVNLSTGISHNSSVCSLGNSMPPSTPKGENEVNSGIWLTALEKPESASIAVKRSENLNSILKAAELAAEAVTQAGKVAMMGNPFPLSELADAGPEGCWKLNFGKEVHSVTVIDRHGVDVNNGSNTSGTTRDTVGVSEKTPGDCSLDISIDDQCKLTSVDISSNIDKPQGTEENPIKEGSFVEIYREGDGVKAAWFSANVLELKDGEAYVCYTEKPPTESFGALKEWIRLDVQGNEAPKVRAPHPMTAMPSEGTRKRRREAMGKCFWSVGDKVDAWRRNCWWEGVITEKSSKDDTAFTVHFSAHGETDIIKACYLRPSLIWQDGKWVEWSSSMSNDGDTRQEKRVKLYDPELKVEGTEKASENIDPIESKIQEDSRLLGLSDKEITFNVGKSSKEVKKPVTHRMARTGLQNEGKTVNTGVSNPGKKRKFMDVSQHYVSRDGKMNENNDSTRRAKMSIPKGSGLPVWRNSTRVDLQEKKVPAIQPKVPNTRILPAISDRTLDKNSVSSTGSRNDNALRPLGMTGFASFSSIGKSRKSPFELSSTSNENSFKKMPASTRSKADLSSKIKFEPPSKKLEKIEENKDYNSAGTSNSESLEPRRSNRRIQPTSRLLEGLQTSLSTPKLPSASHDKGLKNHNRNASTRSTH